MQRKWLIPVAILVVAAVVAALAIFKPWESPADTSAGKDPSSTVVGADGGTFTFHDGLTVLVPKGAVNGETTLTVTQPQTLKAEEGPFAQLRKAGSAFDISLTQGDKHDIQPAQPLEVTFPLTGTYRPEVAANATPLLYTPGQTPGSYLWLPSRIEKNLARVSVGHLSPKYLVYVEGKSLLDSFQPKKIETDHGECPQNATIADQKVKLKATGWSLNNDSPIFACLLAGPNGSVGVGVTNRADYILTASATSDVKNLAASQGDFEEELFKLVAKQIPGGEKIKAYLGRGGKLTSEISPSNLPATIELQSDPRTFAAESTVRVLGLAVGVLTGEGRASKSLQLLDTLLKKGELVTCLQKSLGSLADNLTVKTVADSVGNCFIVMFKLVTEQMDLGTVLWRGGWLLDAFKAIVDTAVSAGNGAWVTLRDTLRIEVQADAPPCPTGKTLQQILQAAETPPVKVWNSQQTRCQFPYAYGTTEIGLGDPQTDTVMSYVVHYDGKAWKEVARGQDMGENPYCPQAPDFVRKWMSCRI